MAVDEAGGRARRQGQFRNAGGISRSLRLTRRKRNNEVPVHAAGHTGVHSARRGAGLASTRAKAGIGCEATILELLDHQERTIRISSNREVPNVSSAQSFPQVPESSELLLYGP